MTKVIKAYGDMAMPSGLSWNGFVVEGDEKSIKEVKRLIWLEGRLEWFEKEYARLMEDRS